MTITFREFRDGVPAEVHMHAEGAYDRARSLAERLNAALRGVGIYSTAYAHVECHRDSAASVHVAIKLSLTRGDAALLEEILRRSVGGPYR